MNGADLSRRDRRALLLGTLLVVPLLFFTLIARPYWQALGAARSSLAVERQLLARERALLAAAVTYPGALESAESRLRQEASRLFGGTDAVAIGGALSGYVAGQARESGVLLEEVRSLEPVSVDSGVMAHPLELRSLGDLEGVLTLLHAIETGPRLVRIERLEIERAPAEAWDPGARVLSLTASLHGFSLRPPPGGWSDVREPREAP